MKWYPQEVGGISGTDVTDIRHAIDKAKLMNGSEGTVAINADALTEMLSTMEAHQECTSKEDYDALMEERNDFEGKAEERDTYRENLIELQGFLKARKSFPTQQLAELSATLTEETDILLGELDTNEKHALAEATTRAVDAGKKPATGERRSSAEDSSGRVVALRGRSPRRT